MRELELAWAAGFWDGEGTFSIQRVKTGGSEYFYPMASVEQFDPRPLERFHKAVRVGKLYGPYPKTIKGEVRYCRHIWKINGYEPVLAFSELLLPYVSAPKREQILATMNHPGVGPDKRKKPAA